jgi:chitin disaccharide deacetylase
LKRLVINADDFGFTPEVNAGIIHSHRQGVLTATTLMANGDAFDDAVRLARETPTLDIGCHLVLIQGDSLLTGRRLPETARELVVALSRRHIDVHEELRAQVKKILLTGLRPTHLDSHKHTHALPNVFRAVVRIGHEFGIPYVRLPFDAMFPFARVPLRLARRQYCRWTEGFNVLMTDHFTGFRLTGSLTEKTLAAAICSLREGLTEFMCHPGFVGPALLEARTRLKESRLRELEALTSPRIRQIIAAQGVQLENFSVG